MEAPEKVYLQPSAIKQLPHQNIVYIKPLADNSIEYVRKDAFIEKAEEFICSALNDGIMGTANIEDFMRLFKKYMEDKI